MGLIDGRSIIILIMVRIIIESGEIWTFKAQNSALLGELFLAAIWRHRGRKSGTSDLRHSSICSIPACYSAALAVVLAPTFFLRAGFFVAVFRFAFGAGAFFVLVDLFVVTWVTGISDRSSEPSVADLSSR